MSNLLEQASLVMIPSGYKEDIVYSVIPTSGAGDLTFTRASNGTRVNSAGLVEVVPWNLLQYSEQFTNAIWSPKNGTFTDNFATAPNGTQTACKWVATDSDPYIYQAFNGQNIDYTVTCWVKATGTAIGKNCSIRIAGNAVFVAMTGEWQQLTITGNINGSVNVGVEAPESATIGEIVYIWGFQVNIGSTAKPYFPTTDRLNVPRLTYQNGGGGCPSLLLEKQSTNLITNSEDFTQTSWTKYQATITGNNTTSPDGTQNADKFVDNTNNDIHAVYLGITISSDTTISIYVKSAEYTRFAIANLSDGGDVIFNLSTVAVVSASANFKNNKIESVGNGWYRVSATTNGTSGAKAMGFLLVNDSNQLSFVGTGSKGVYIWGAQYETSSYSTSYIPTTSSSATRVADACYKTGIGSLIGQTEGTIFAEINYQLNNPIDDTRIQLSDGSTSKWIFLSLPEGGSGNLIRGYINNSSASFQLSFYGSTPLIIGRNKIAFAYKSGNFALYLNGVSVATNSTTGTIPSCSDLTIGGSTPTSRTQTEIGQFNEAILFPTRLTNSELAQLTGNQNYTINQAYASYGVASESPNCVQP